MHSACADLNKGKTPYILSTAVCPQMIWIATKPLTIYLPSTKLRGSLGKEGHMWIPKWKKLLLTSILSTYQVPNNYPTAAGSSAEEPDYHGMDYKWVSSLSDLYRIQDIHKKLECVRTKYSFLITSIQLLNSSIIFELKIVSSILWIYIKDTICIYVHNEEEEEVVGVEPLES